jgi:hypothetical protein
VIRPAKLADIPMIVSLAVESVSRDALPVKNDTAAMEALARQLIGNPAHFVWVGETDGIVDSCVAAAVQPGFWFRGLQASVLLYYARPPGSVALLLRRLSAWIKGRSGIKMAIIELEPGTDPRLERLLGRIGFNRKSDNMTYVRQP